MVDTNSTLKFTYYFETWLTKDNHNKLRVGNAKLKGSCYDLSTKAVIRFHRCWNSMLVRIFAHGL